MNLASDALVSAIFITGTVILIYGPWQSGCVDLIRQRLFENRDRLFDLAAEGKIGFRSEAYQQSREFINGTIRFAHLLTWQRFLLLKRSMKGKPFPKASPINLEEIEDLETRTRVQAIVSSSAMLIASLIIIRSPVVTAFFLVATPILGSILFLLDSFSMMREQAGTLILSIVNDINTAEQSKA